MHSTEITVDTVDRYEREHDFKASSFDLAVQVMIVACSYEPDDIWLAGNDNVVKIASELVTTGAADSALDVLEYAIEQGRVHLNMDLIAAIATQQITRLHRLHADRKEEFELPEHGDETLSPFPPGAEITGPLLMDDRFEGAAGGAVATEKFTGRKVIFRPIDLDLTRAYIESFHYLHTARDDDSLAFGAFVDKANSPFAIVSYSPVSRTYKKNILNAAGIDHRRALELTRAWNSEASPKNTMSMLYGYAHASIQRLSDGESVEQQAIITAVNPNLGFKGSAFRAVGFGLIGEKPTSYHYLVDENGQKAYLPRRSLTDISRMPSTSAQCVTAALPLLPTKELAVIMRGRRRLQPATNVIYRVSEAEYRHEALSI
ncbi:hypothetical protein ACQP1G_13520 [Nocardia sp. CA-107356]|uniref:Mom family adenine methylcarbamoylation protein n=1 Tax=Nocardia sp. CA-107356 TaxID=3239972 RepID=UPI003D908C60